MSIREITNLLTIGDVEKLLATTCALPKQTDLKGVSNYMVKPFGVETLTGEIERVLCHA